MKSKPNLTVYEHKESVCCHKVAITLAEKQIAAEIVNISLEKQEQRQAWYLKINPLGVVPALVHSGRTVIHSTILTEYLDDAFPDPPLMPVDPYWRARRRLWARRIDDEMHVPHISAISFVVAFGRQMRERMKSKEQLDAYFANIKDERYRETIRSWYESDLDSALLRKSLLAYHGFLREMEVTLQESSWLAGADFSLADIDVIPYIWRLSNLQLGFLWEELPSVADWFERVTSRPAFKTAIIDAALPEWVEGMRASGTEAKPKLQAIVASFEHSSA